MAVSLPVATSSVLPAAPLHCLRLSFVLPNERGNASGTAEAGFTFGIAELQHWIREQLRCLCRSTLASYASHLDSHRCRPVACSLAHNLLPGADRLMSGAKIGRVMHVHALGVHQEDGQLRKIAADEHRE